MKSSLEAFADGGSVYVAEYRYSATADIIQARAKMVLLQGGYDVVARNCEHLATWCVTGVGKSLQVQDKIVEKMAKVAEFVEKATHDDPNGPKKETLARVVAAVPLPILHMVLDFTNNQVEKLGKNLQFS